MKKSYFLLGLFIMALFACSQGSHPVPAAPSERARTSQSLLVELKKNPDSTALRKEFLLQFKQIFLSDDVPWSIITEATYKIYGDMLIQADRLARGGSTACLKAIMLASFGSFVRTSEGSEWIDEILWAIFQDHTQLSLNALTELPDAARHKLINEVYTNPIHDEYDFTKILAALQHATLPANLQQVVPKIIAVVERNAAANAKRQIDSKVGVVYRDHRNKLLLTLPNSALKAGSKVVLISVPGHSRLCCAEIVKRLGQGPGIGHQIIISGYTQDTTYLMKMDKADAAVQLGFGIIDSPKIFSSRAGAIRADLNRDGIEESFRDCTSHEGVHLTIWSGQALKGPRLWHAYYFLEYDVEPSCVKQDYAE